MEKYPNGTKTHQAGEMGRTEGYGLRGQVIYNMDGQLGWKAWLGPRSWRQEQAVKKSIDRGQYIHPKPGLPSQSPGCRCFPQIREIHFRPKGTCKLKLKGWRSIYHTNVCQKKAKVAIVILDKLDFNRHTKKRQRRALYNHKGAIQQQDIQIISIYAPIMGSSKYIKIFNNKHKGTH